MDNGRDMDWATNLSLPIIQAMDNDLVCNAILDRLDYSAVKIIRGCCSWFFENMNVQGSFGNRIDVLTICEEGTCYNKRDFSEFELKETEEFMMSMKDFYEEAPFGIFVDRMGPYLAPSVVKISLRYFSSIGLKFVIEHFLELCGDSIKKLYLQLNSLNHIREFFVRECNFVRLEKVTITAPFQYYNTYTDLEVDEHEDLLLPNLRQLTIPFIQMRHIEVLKLLSSLKLSGKVAPLIVKSLMKFDRADGSMVREMLENCKIAFFKPRRDSEDPYPLADCVYEAPKGRRMWAVDPSTLRESILGDIRKLGDW